MGDGSSVDQLSIEIHCHDMFPLEFLSGRRVSTLLPLPAFSDKTLYI